MNIHHVEKHELCSQTGMVKIPALSLSSWVTLDKLLNLSVSFSICEMG